MNRNGPHDDAVAAAGDDGGDGQGDGRDDGNAHGLGVLR